MQVFGAEPRGGNAGSWIWGEGLNIKMPHKVPVHVRSWSRGPAGEQPYSRVLLMQKLLFGHKLVVFQVILSIPCDHHIGDAHYLFPLYRLKGENPRILKITRVA